MKKIITLIIFFSLSIQSINAQCDIAYNYDFKNITDLEKRDLKGKIKSVAYSHYELNNSFGEISRGTIKCQQEVLFNEDGTVNKITEYDSKGEIKDVDIHEYENGEIKLISHYNNKGILVAKTAYIKDGLDIREQRYSADGSLNDQYFIRSYDLNGNMIKEIWKYHENKKYTSINKFNFDKNNRVIKFIDENDILIITYRDNYSKIPAKIERLDPSTKKIKIETTYKFNSQGSIIKEYDIDKLSRSYEYIYDNKNNWINQTIFRTEAKIPDEIIERKINYYE
jgi:hypothetical protein